jgi:hypothetical protein
MDDAAASTSSPVIRAQDAKSTLDAGWAMFKTAEAGVEAYSTQIAASVSQVCE